jgi:hypothetical protein
MSDELYPRHEMPGLPHVPNETTASGVPSFAATCSAFVTVEFLCDECGEFEVIKSKSTLVQFCGCGKAARPVRIVNASIKQGGEWLVYSLPNTQADR